MTQLITLIFKAHGQCNTQYIPLTKYKYIFLAPQYRLLSHNDSNTEESARNSNLFFFSENKTVFFFFSEAKIRLEILYLYTLLKQLFFFLIL